MMIVSGLRCGCTASGAVICAIFLLMSPTVQAAEADDRDGVPNVETNLGVRFDYDSNIFDTSSDAVGDKEESWIGVATPEILLSLENGSRGLELGYVGEYGKYIDSSDDNFDDHAISARARFKLGQRGELDLTGGFQQGHYARGEGLTRGFDPALTEFPDDPDEFDESQLQGRFGFGAPGARGKLDLIAGTRDLDYTNNDLRTRFHDHSTDSGIARLGVAVAGNTSLLLEAQYMTVAYDVDPIASPGRDADEWRYLLGVTWDITGKTTGSVKVGTQRREYDDNRRRSDSGASWEVDIRWSPRSYSHIDLTTSRSNQEPIGTESVIHRTNYGVEWSHEWSDSWQTVLGWELMDDEFLGLDRDEQLDLWSINLVYVQQRWLSWEAGLKSRVRDASADMLEYNGTLFSFGVNISI